MPPPPSFDQFLSYNQPSKDKGGRAPPRVDTSAASMSIPKISGKVALLTIHPDRSYMRQGQLTPVSNSSGSRSVSPKTPSGRPGAGGRGEDYFAPKIANEYDSTPPQSRRPGGYGGLKELDSYDVDPLYPQNSPKKQPPSLLQRMNSIAPGPFESNRKPSARNAFPKNDRQEREPEPSFLDSSRAGNGPERPGTSASNMSSNSNGSGGSSNALRLPRKNGYGGFGPPEKSRDELEPQPFGMNRAETFPKPSEITEPPFRTPSAPGPRPDRLRRPSNDTRGPINDNDWQRRPSNASNDMRGPVNNGERQRRPSNASNDMRIPMTGERSRRPSNGPDTSRPPPPRTSLVRPRTAGGSSNSIPTINLADEFGIGNPYHTPSASISSNASMFSKPSMPSSQTSPSKSWKSVRNPSDTSTFDSLMSDLQSSMNELKPELDLSPPKPKVGLPDRRAPRSMSRGENGLPPMRSKSQGPARAPSRSRSPLRSPMMPTNRYDLALQDNRAPRAAGSDSRPDFRSGSRAGDAAPGLGEGRSRERSPQSGSPSRAGGSRGNCRACSLPIVGKSISSADGRLSGRYHKACFVCTTCTKPFSTSTFYVMDDQPYCEQHYHVLNGSLCHQCGDGIEGEYLEDEEKRKHHSGCFRCGDCGVVLRDGYFDVQGKAYCERDAWKRVQQPWMVSPPPMPGLPTGPGAPAAAVGAVGRPFGLPGAPRLGARPRMEKRMTRMGMI